MQRSRVTSPITLEEQSSKHYDPIVHTAGREAIGPTGQAWGNNLTMSEMLVWIRDKQDK